MKNTYPKWALYIQLSVCIAVLYVLFSGCGKYASTRKYDVSSLPSDSTFIVQKYIHNDSLLSNSLLVDSILLNSVAVDSVFDPVKNIDDTIYFDKIYSKNVAGLRDSISMVDTITMKSDSLVNLPKKKKAGLEKPVMYKCVDSLEFDMDNKLIVLYNNSDVTFDGINLTAYQISIDFDNDIVEAIGIRDSIGQTISDAPVFKDGEQTFTSEHIAYNYKTKKGRINAVITEQGEGYLHGGIIKRMEDETINVKYGSYTTCNLPHPHYEFRFWKASVIPQKYIATGPVYMSVEDVPTPLILPLGLFPNNAKRRSGIVIPTIGENARKGFYLGDGGYYWWVNDYLDVKLTGSIYTNGSWGIKPEMRYAKRYKFSGNFLFQYEKNIEGDKGTSNYVKANNFRLQWNHRQDAKANPNITFSSSVNFMSSNFNEYNYTNVNNTLSSTFNSSISLQAKLSPNWNLTAGVTLSQNTTTKIFSFTLPTIAISANTWTPFRKKIQVGKIKWYENITVNYDMQLENRVNIADSMIFTSQFLTNMNNGIVNRVKINIPFKLLKFISFNNSFNLTEKFYSSSINKSVAINSNQQESVVRDTTYGFKPVFEFNYTAGLSTKIYGIYTLKSDVVKAFRHVVTPSVNFTFRPDFSTPFWGYYDSYNLNGKEVKYSKFEGSVFGAPGMGSSGLLTMSIDNNLEMKVRNRKDTITGEKRVKLIENFRVSTSYDFMKDSLNWSPLAISANTTLFDALRVSFACQFNPYATDKDGRLINKFEKDITKRLMRFENYSWNLSFDWGLNSTKFKKKKEPVKPPTATDPEWDDFINNPEHYVDFNVDWDFRISYVLNYGLRMSTKDWIQMFERDITQSINFSGSVNITPKTKLTLLTGYDFKNKEIAFSRIDIVRDLHCWEMGFSWIPFGMYRQWEFRINVKASMLQDLKLTKKRDMRDF